ncbi:AraC family transcriptional regulator [Blastopirellula marina]|uniref:AraC family transcriptional regulator n=1 Tax=Blastopirellula marina TaxID=124 RepID=UPI00068074E1|nr:AraC family transcriptional regulator [Blastopirellula marina]
MSTTINKWERLAVASEKLRDQVICGEYFISEAAKWELTETLISEPCTDSVGQDDFYFVSLLINAGSTRTLEHDLGEGRFRRPPRPGSMIFGYEPRALLSQGGGPLHSIGIYIPAQLLQSRFAELWGKEMPSPDKLLSSHFLDSGLEVLIKRLNFECRQSRSPEKSLTIEPFFDAILDRLFLIAGRKLPEIKPNDRLRPDAVTRAIEFIDAHFHQELRLDEIAQVAGVSRCHFSRLFRQTMGQSLKQYLVEIRLNKAQEILEFGASDLTVGQIAQRCGFCDRQHLIREFRRKYGVTPDLFRRFL